MKNRYRMFRRRGGVYYLQDSATGKQESLRTIKRAEAESLWQARNNALQQPLINLEIAKAYLIATDPKMAQRTWEDVMREYATHGRDSSQERSRRMAQSPSLASIRNLKLIETQAEDFLELLRGSGSATNNYLRRYHNLALNLPRAGERRADRAISTHRFSLRTFNAHEILGSHSTRREV